MHKRHSTTATHYENSESICLFGELWVKKKNAKFAENFIFITSVYSFVEFVCDFFLFLLHIALLTFAYDYKADKNQSC